MNPDLLVHKIFHCFKNHSFRLLDFLYSVCYSMNFCVFFKFYFSMVVYIQHCTFCVYSNIVLFWVVRQLYTLQSGPPDTSSIHLAPYTVTTVLLTVFPVLSFTSLWLFYNYQFILLNPFTFCPQPANPLPSCNHQSVFWTSMFFLLSLTIHFRLSSERALGIVTQWYFKYVYALLLTNTVRF